VIFRGSIDQTTDQIYSASLIPGTPVVNNKVSFAAANWGNSGSVSAFTDYAYSTSFQSVVFIGNYDPLAPTRKILYSGPVSGGAAIRLSGGTAVGTVGDVFSFFLIGQADVGFLAALDLTGVTELYSAGISTPDTAKKVNIAIGSPASVSFATLTTDSVTTPSKILFLITTGPQAVLWAGTPVQPPVNSAYRLSSSVVPSGSVTSYVQNIGPNKGTKVFYTGSLLAAGTPATTIFDLFTTFIQAPCSTAPTAPTVATGPTNAPTPLPPGQTFAPTAVTPAPTPSSASTPEMLIVLLATILLLVL